MVPNGAAYDNYPPFANNGTKTPPGGSTESAKYALGMVPADTFPAEWSNYLFHGATAGITRLNNDTGSIKKEINSVLSNFNITPDATLNNQLLEALTKLKAEAALAAHPVGSLYWTASTENPATTFGGGTWSQIKDKFILAAGDTYSNGATGGSATVTLTENQIPSHSHSFTPSGTIASTSGGTNGKTATESAHTHSYSHTHEYTPAGTIASTSGGSDGKTSTPNSNTVTITDPGHYHTYYTGGSAGSGANAALRSSVKESGTYWDKTTDTKTTGITASHSHTHTAYFTGTKKSTTSQSTTTTGTGSAHSHTAYFTGTAGTTGTKGGGQAHNNMPPYIVKFCWERVS